MKFAHPWVLLLLLVPAAAAVWEWRRNGRAVSFPFDLVSLPSGRHIDQIIRLSNCLPVALASLAIVLLAEPQRQMQGQVERDVRNIQLLIDSSGSMKGSFGPSGMTKHDVAMNAIEAFIHHRKGDAFGLTLFGGDVLNWVPLTKDSDNILQSRAFLNPARLPPAIVLGTATGLALNDVCDQLAATKTGDRTVIVITDGIAGDLPPAAVAQVVKKLIDTKVVLFTVIINDDGTPSVASQISEATGGAAFGVGSEEAMAKVFAHIDEMTPAHLKPVSNARVDWFGPVLAGAAVLLSIHLLLLLKLRFTPW